MRARTMELARDPIARVASDAEIWSELLELADGWRLVELGCGSATHTRAIAVAAPLCTLVAFEVDRVQLTRNAAANTLPNVSFRYGGAEAIACADDSIDVVFMFKSLHHVPVAALPRALAEIRRILRPGGQAYVCEPIFAGPLNDIIRLFHDEDHVRRAAFTALCAAVARGELELVQQLFYRSPTRFADFAEFESRILRATHTEHRLSAEMLAEVERRFALHCGAGGACFEAPMRVDLLRKPLS